MNFDRFPEFRPDLRKALNVCHRALNPNAPPMFIVHDGREEDCARCSKTNKPTTDAEKLRVAREALERIAKYGRDNPGCGYSSATIAIEALEILGAK